MRTHEQRVDKDANRMPERWRKIQFHTVTHTLRARETAPTDRTTAAELSWRLPGRARAPYTDRASRNRLPTILCSPPRIIQTEISSSPLPGRWTWIGGSPV